MTRDNTAEHIEEQHFIHHMFFDTSGDKTAIQRTLSSYENR